MSPAQLARLDLSEEMEAAVERASQEVPATEFLEAVGDLVRASGNLLEPEVAALAILDELGLAQAAEVVAPEYAKVLAPEDLEPKLNGIVVDGTLLGLDPTRTFRRKDGSMGFVTNARVRGELGIYNITLWDEHIKGLVGVEPGEQVRLMGLYTKERNGQIELHTGRDCRISLPDDDQDDEA